jgi:hypothetical protein
MLSSPNDESPANVDAAVGVYNYLFVHEHVPLFSPSFFLEKFLRLKWQKYMFSQEVSKLAVQATTSYCIVYSATIKYLVMNVGCILYFASDAHKFHAYILIFL